jgi:hypothetical protein
MRPRIIKSLFFGVAVAAALTGCRDKELEKRVLEVESRLSALEAKRPTPKLTSTTPALSTTQPGTEAAAQEEKKPEGPLPVMQFATMEHDFGTVKEGDVVEYTFQVKNTGEAPLIIQNASPSCGCTVPDWTKAPIAAGGSGFVKAKFDSKGKSGIQNKTITITANTWPKQSVLRFKANITPKSDGSNGPVK